MAIVDMGVEPRFGVEGRVVAGVLLVEGPAGNPGRALSAATDSFHHGTWTASIRLRTALNTSAGTRKAGSVS